MNLKTYTSNVTPTIDSANSILLRGAPGAHKTTFCLQFPKVGVIDCDENLKGPVDYIEKVLKKSITFKHVRARYDDAGKALDDPKSWWSRYVSAYNTMIQDPEIGVVVTDSLTGLDEILLRRTMAQQGQIEDMRIQDWIPFRLKLREIMFTMRQSGKTNIVICHEETKRNKLQEIVGYDIFLSSKLSEIFGWVFTDVWYIEAQPDLAGQRRPSKLYTAPYGQRKDLKSMQSSMPGELDATFEEVGKYLKL